VPEPRALGGVGLQARLQPLHARLRLGQAHGGVLALGAQLGDVGVDHLPRALEVARQLGADRRRVAARARQFGGDRARLQRVGLRRLQLRLQLPHARLVRRRQFAQRRELVARVARGDRRRRLGDALALVLQFGDVALLVLQAGDLPVQRGQQPEGRQAADPLQQCALHPRCSRDGRLRYAVAGLSFGARPPSAGGVPAGHGGLAAGV
jgi:hypothetical protein